MTKNAGPIFVLFGPTFFHDLYRLNIFFKGPPPDPGFNFLSDRSREGPLSESKQNVHRRSIQQPSGNRRHPRNYGGPNIRDVKSKILHEKQRDVSTLQMHLAVNWI